MKLLKFTQTVFVTKDGYNKVTLDFDEVKDGAYIETLGVSALVTTTHMSILIPDIKTPTLAAVILRLPDGSSITYTEKLSPVRKIKVSFIESSHEDAGSDDCANRTDERTSRILDAVSMIINEFPDYRYTAESFGWITAYEKCRPEKQISVLKEFVKKGVLEINPIHTSLQTHLLGYEEFPRSLYSIIHLKNKWNIYPETVMLTDVSGISSAAVTAFAAAGIKYAIIRPSVFRNAKSPDNFPPVFRLMSPNGRDSLIVFNQAYEERSILEQLVPKNIHDIKMPDIKDYDPKDAYLASRILVKKTETNTLEDTIDDISKKYPDYGIAPVLIYKNQQMPNLTAYAFCDYMNAKWKNPEFSLSTSTECMKYIEAYAGKSIPTVYGEMSDHTSDAVTAYPSLFTKKKRCAEQLSAIETATLLKCIENPGSRYPKQTIDSAYENLRKFSSYLPLESIKSPIEKILFNYEFIKKSAINKVESAIEKIDISITNGKAENFITALNVSPCERKFSLTINKPLANCKCQKIGDKYITEPIPFPPFGTKSFMEEGDCSNNNGFATVTSNTINTGIYSVSYDNQSGRIYSIIETSALRELIDSKSEFSLGDFIYTTTDSKDSQELDINIQKTSSVRVENGELAVTLIKEGFEEQSRATVKACITFYKHTKNIDLSLEFSGASALMGDFSDRFRKNIFWAIPLKCESGRFITENGGFPVDELINRLSLNTRDFSAATTWSAVENDTFGTAVFSKDTTVFHYGKLRYNNFSNNYNASSASMFLYAASNRLNQLVYKTPVDCCGKFTLTLLPYSGKCKDTVSRNIAQSLTKPLIYRGYSIERSRLSLSADNVRMTAFKSAEDGNGFIARFLETSGDASKPSLTLPCKIKQAFYTDIIENNIMEITDFSDHTIEFNISKYSYTTLRIIPERDYSIKYEHEDSGIITDYFSYTGHCGRNVVVWTKKSFENTCRYDIICDGCVVATVDDQPYHTQLYMTDITGCHKFEVKVSE